MNSQSEVSLLYLLLIKLNYIYKLIVKIQECYFLQLLSFLWKILKIVAHCNQQFLVSYCNFQPCHIMAKSNLFPISIEFSIFCFVLLFLNFNFLFTHFNILCLWFLDLKNLLIMRQPLLKFIFFYLFEIYDAHFWFYTNVYVFIAKNLFEFQFIRENPQLSSRMIFKAICFCILSSLKKKCSLTIQKCQHLLFDGRNS